MRSPWRPTGSCHHNSQSRMRDSLKLGKRCGGKWDWECGGKCNNIVKKECVCGLVRFVFEYVMAACGRQLSECVGADVVARDGTMGFQCKFPRQQLRNRCVYPLNFMLPVPTWPMYPPTTTFYFFTVTHHEPAKYLFNKSQNRSVHWGWGWIFQL